MTPVSLEGRRSTPDISILNLYRKIHVPMPPISVCVCVLVRLTESFSSTPAVEALTHTDTHTYTHGVVLYCLCGAVIGAWLSVL